MSYLFFSPLWMADVIFYWCFKIIALTSNIFLLSYFLFHLYYFQHFSTFLSRLCHKSAVYLLQFRFNHRSDRRLLTSLLYHKSIFTLSSAWKACVGRWLLPLVIFWDLFLHSSQYREKRVLSGLLKSAWRRSFSQLVFQFL